MLLENYFSLLPFSICLTKKKTSNYNIFLFFSIICECWAVLSTDSTLVQDLLDQLKRYMKTIPLYEEQGGGDIKVASLQPLESICALHELLKNSHLKEVCLQQFPELFSLLLVCVATFMGTVAPAAKKVEKKEKYSYFSRDIYKLVPAKVAMETFRLFLNCCEYDKMSSALMFINNTETVGEFSLFLEVSVFITTFVNFTMTP